MQLCELQRGMMDALLTPLKDDIAKPDYIQSSPKLDAHERLEIYRRSYWYRLINAFYDDFPGLHTLLGDDAFDRLTHAYLTQFPSRSFTLRDLGQFLQRWVTENPEFFEDQYTISLDMVNLEWAHIEAFDGAERRMLTLEELANASADSCFALQPHLHLLELSFPVDDVRINPKRVRTARRYEGARIYLAVYRNELTVYYKRLEREPFMLLKFIRERATLEEAIAQAFKDSAMAPEEQARMLQESFGNWASLGWLCGRESC
jgi:hypothetical protein